jgi:hypothetical protein
MEIVKISAIKANIKNPRQIKDDKFKKLVQSIRDFPDMLNKRPLICFTDVDGKYVVLGGNMRLKAAQEVGLKEMPIILADDWTQEQKDEFLIKDNVGFGEWDWDQLANEWDVVKLDEWGLDIPNFNKNIDNEEGEIKISTELDQHSNYIVLKFNTDIDWLQVQSIFGLASTYSLRQNGKTWSKGIGRVIDGIDAILKIKESSNEG